VPFSLKRLNGFEREQTHGSVRPAMDIAAALAVPHDAVDGDTTFWHGQLWNAAIRHADLMNLSHRYARLLTSRQADSADMELASG
jgi:hypothetical protein